MSSTLFFRELTLRNFLSFGNNDTVIDLSDPGTICIEGQNLDQGGSNGAGKTSIINALCYALYNKPFDNISLQRLINSTNAIKNTLMEVRLTFEKGGVEYEVYRARGEEYRIEVRQNGVDITPGKGVTECDAMIEDIIGISFDLFTKTVIFSGNSPAFLQLPIAQQRNQIEELFNITMLSEKARVLKDNIRNTEQDIKIAEALATQQQVAVDLHRRHVTDAQERVRKWDTARQVDMETIVDQLAAIATVDFDAEKLLHDERVRLKEQGSYLATKLAPIRKDHQILIKDVERLMDEEEHLTSAHCPYCAQTFPDASTKLALVQQEMEGKATRLVEMEKQLTALSDEARSNLHQLNEVEREIKHPNLTDLMATRENAAALTQKLNDLKNATNPHVDALEQLRNEAVQEVDHTKVDALRRRLDHQQFLLKLLTDKNSFLRRKIINQTIPFLNNRLNFYTATLGLPHVVKFDADMSCTVSEYGRELDFGNLSAGEKKRVNTSMSLAFRDVLHHLHARTNLLLIDELDGALDPPGIDAVVRVLKEKSRDEDTVIFLISHHPNIAGRLDRTLLIQKSGGFSEVLMEGA